MSRAEEYVRHGLAVVPIPHGQKGPTTEGWNKFDNVITDPSGASRLNGNIGLGHAHCTPTPTMALDIDDMSRASAWLAERGVDLAELLAAEDAVQIVSGKAGRAKLLFRLPQGIDPIESLTLKEEVLADA